MIPAQSSAPRPAARSIEPVTSAKRTVTCLRSPSSARRSRRIFSARCSGVAGRATAPPGATPSDAPHPPQNRSPGPLVAPQRAQVSVIVSRAMPHSAQNFRPAQLAVPQPGQRLSLIHSPQPPPLTIERTMPATSRLGDRAVEPALGGLDAELGAAGGLVEQFEASA